MRRFVRLLGAFLCLLAAVPWANATEPARWKAVLLAGDDSAQVFENAVTDLSAQFRQRGVIDMRVLSASPRASRGETRATLSNLSQAMASLNIGEGDGCLLYLTSHGNEEGLFMRADRENKQNLAPEALARILDTYCKSRPTVVVVSACHSGTFLRDGIVGDDRIILTAARKDRVSFGCDFRLRYNYFDSCVLRVIDRSATWADLFFRVDTCIEEQEKSLNERPSEPQASFGDHVEDLPLPHAG